MNATLAQRQKIARRHAPKKGSTRGEIEAGVDAICKRWLVAMYSGWPQNRPLDRMNLRAVIEDGHEQLQRVLLQSVGPDPE
jgi:hypothetical protein